MPTFSVLSEQTQFDVTTRPSMPGLGVRVSGVSGTFEATLRPDGAVDLDRPVSGTFSLLVEDLQTGNWLVTTALRHWLAGDREAAVVGRIRSVLPRDDGRCDVGMTIETRGRTVQLVGTGRVHTRPNGRVEAAGSTICDPRAFGVPLPPLLNLMVHVRWRLILTKQ